MARKMMLKHVGSMSTLRTSPIHTVQRGMRVYAAQYRQDETTSAPRSSRRSRARSDDKDDADWSSVDLVGPPDPVSNIRPMVYARPQSVQRTREKSSNTPSSSPDHSSAQPHPYSVNEFSSPSNRFTAPAGQRTRRPLGLGMFSLYRQYVDHVCDRVEECELKLRLSKLTTDATTQRFWRDNNARFTRDLHAWQGGQKEDSKQIEDVVTQTDKTQQSDQQLAIAGLSSESDFYATWLRANAKRNKAYNILVWQQAFAQVRLGAQATVWRTWLRLLQRLEGS